MVGRKSGWGCRWRGQHLDRPASLLLRRRVGLALNSRRRTLGGVLGAAVRQSRRPRPCSDVALQQLVHHGMTAPGYHAGRSREYGRRRAMRYLRDRAATPSMMFFPGRTSAAMAFSAREIGLLSVGIAVPPAKLLRAGDDDNRA